MVFVDRKKGMALLLAVIITGAALSIALGIQSLMFGQLKLGQSARESHVAFFSADAGKECALYYLWRGTDEPGKSFWSPVDPCNGGAFNCQIVCFGETIPVTIAAGGLPTDEYEYTFTAQVDTSGSAGTPPFWDESTGICADIEVRSQFFECSVLGSVNSYQRTIIDSHGYSYCNGAARGGVNRTLRVAERSLDTGKCPPDTL